MDAHKATLISFKLISDFLPYASVKCLFSENRKQFFSGFSHLDGPKRGTPIGHCGTQGFSKIRVCPMGYRQIAAVFFIHRGITH
jgi:hypothetical protein